MTNQFLSILLLSAGWIKFFQFFIALSILILLHEWGHYYAARRTGTRVEKFYLFFNPGFSLWKKKIGDTEYGLGWIPFGGYVKIAGMIDESMDKEQLNKAPESYELRSKPAYQRLIVMLGGVIVNVILAIVIFIGIAWFWGDEFLPAKNLSYGIHPTEISKKMGLKEGDIIMSLDQKELKDFFELESKIVLEDAKTIQIKRGDSLLSLSIPTTVAAELSNANNATAFVLPLFPVIVDSIGKSAVMVEGSFQKNDTLLSINGESVKYQHEFIEVKKKYSDSLVTVIAKRGLDTVTVRTLINNKAQLGLFVKLPMQLFKTVHQAYSFAEAIPTGIQRCFTTLDNYVTGIKQIFTGKVAASDSLGSVISIGNTFPGTWDWERFWTLTGIFSIILAFMNILPIPALDGGHALFTLYEMITKRKPSDKFMEYAQMVGMVLLLSLMVYALGLDFWRLFK